jgi:hypothetical protein
MPARSGWPFMQPQSIADLLSVPRDRSAVPTFAEYVPVVAKVVTAGTRRAYGSYWNRIVNHWGDRRLDEPTPSDIRQLMAYVKTHVVARSNARGGCSRRGPARPGARTRRAGANIVTIRIIGAPPCCIARGHTPGGACGSARFVRTATWGLCPWGLATYVHALDQR